MAAMALFVSATVAQAQMKVDEEGIKKKLAKSDADIQNPKKNTKAATWIARGKVYYEAATAPTSGLYAGMDEKAATIMFGKPKTSSKQIGDVNYKSMVFPYFCAYADDKGLIVMWETSLKLAENPLGTAYDAYVKAYELDKNAKVQSDMESLVNAYKQDAQNAYSLVKYKDAAKMFRNAYDIEKHPALNRIDTASVFNAGYLYTLANDYENGVQNLQIAKDLGYENNGDIYYLMYYCYNGLKDSVNAKQILLDGLAKYPKNTNIVTYLLAFYANGGGDPQEIIPIVQKSIEDDPKNPDLWSGLGRIYDKLGQPDKSIEAFAKAAELIPKDFGAQFNLGLLYIKKGDEMNKEMNGRQFDSQKEYNEALAAVNAVYAQSIAPLEKALELNPKEAATLELLKNVCFRLRDEPGIMEKYNKYNEMFKSLPQQPAQ